MRWSRPLLLWWFATVVCTFAQKDVDEEKLYFPDDEIFRKTQQRTPIPPTSVRPGNTPPTTQRPLPQPQTTQRPLPLVLKSTGKSLQMCRKYAESVYYKVQDPEDDTYYHSIDTCTLIEPLIVNGTVAQPREFPHMALVGWEGTIGIQWKCGGSLISNRFVLSAAHCNPNNPKRVRLGDYNIRSTKDDEENNARSVEYDIIKIIVHPDYDSGKGYNDITLFQLNRDVEFNEYIRPICLHTEYGLPKGHGIISGWGNTENGGRQSNILLKGNVSYVPGKDCGEMLNPSLSKKQSEVRDEMMICAANFVNGTDSCQADSGGPLQYRLKDPYCMYSLVGITSFGIGCGYDQGKYPGVYTRVSNYVPWIESIVWPESPTV